MKKFALSAEKSSTFNAKKINKDSKRYELHKYAKATLGSGVDLREAVQVPKDEDENEWIASNTIDFYNKIGLLYDNVRESCTDESCPTMNAGPKYEYLWPDASNKPVKTSAPEYVDKLMAWVQTFFDDETIFPSTTDQEFPKNFKEILKPVYKRLFRVYAHIYHCHFENVMKMGGEAYLNSSFKHFYCFIDHFKLVDGKELQPLVEVITNLTGTPPSKKWTLTLFLPLQNELLSNYFEDENLKNNN